MNHKRISIMLSHAIVLLLFIPAQYATALSPVAFFFDTPQKSVDTKFDSGRVILPDNATNYSDDPEDGTEERPYLIYTAEQIANLNSRLVSNVSDRTAHFKLMADVDMSEYGTNWTNIGSYFKGVFDGNFHKIIGIQKPLFQYLATGASVKQLGIEDCNIITGGSYGNGGVVGDCYGMVERCYVTGSVKSADRAGGIAGVLRDGGAIVDCYNLADVSGAYTSGGLVGDMWGGSVLYHCYNTGNITSSRDSAGGFAGFLTVGVIWNCVSIGPSVSSYYESGAYVGSNYGGVQSSYAYRFMRIDGLTTNSGILRLSRISSTSFWSDDVGLNTEAWVIENGKLPVLRGFESPQDEIPEYIKRGRFPCHTSFTSQ